MSRAVKFSSDLTQGWLIAGISRGRLKEPSQGQQERRRWAAIPDCQHTSYSRSNDGVLMIPAKTPIEPLQTVCLSPVNNLNFHFRYQFSEIHSRGHWLIGQQERVQGCFLVLASYTGSGQGATTVANSQMLSFIGPERSCGGLPPLFPALSAGIKSLPSLTALRWPGHSDKNKHREHPPETAMCGPPHQPAPGHGGRWGTRERVQKTD